MPREKFEHDLHRLQDEILELGAMAERAISESVQTLKNKDIVHAQSIIDADRHINEKRYAIENEALTLIATQQPMAGDLRTLAAILEIASELERMADYARLMDAAHVAASQAAAQLGQGFAHTGGLAQRWRAQRFRRGRGQRFAKGIDLDVVAGVFPLREQRRSFGHDLGGALGARRPVVRRRHAHRARGVHQHGDMVGQQADLT